jgi:phage-related baseplate assembly protein
MAWLTLAQLRSALSEAEARAAVLAELSAQGFDATSWQAGSIARTLVEGFADIYASFTDIVDTFSRICFLDDSQGDALTALADSHYDLDRITSTNAVVLMEFTNTGAPVGSQPASAVVVADSITGLTYTNQSAIAFPVGTAQGSFVAIEPGTASNSVGLAPATVTTMVTTYAGVTCANIDAGGGTSLTTVAIDEETDAELAQRCRARWSTLSYAAPRLAYDFFARTADGDVSRVLVDDDNPAGPGTVYVYIAREDGVATSGDVTTVQAYIDTQRPSTADVTVFAATAQVQNFVGTIYVESTLLDAAKQAEIEDAIAAHINSLDIGGTQISGTGYMMYSELITAISSVEGVIGVNLSTPAADVQFTADSYVMTVGSFTLTYTAI